MNKGRWLMVSIAFLFAFSLLPTYAQVTIYGTIKDEVSTAPVPFAAVVEKNTTNGVVTDIDGKFILTVSSLPVSISVTLIGYEEKVVYVENSKINIQLKPTSYELNEATVRPEKNPADAIIKKVIAKRDSLNPHHLNSYAYNTYNKTIFTSRKDSVNTPLSNIFGNTDTATTFGLDRLFNRQHLFINESVTEKKFLQPGNHHENIIASRTSGLKDPIFSTLTTQLQSLSFYENQSFKILSTEYNNPLSNDAFNNYKYEIVDTSFSGSDTVIIIGFHPKPGKKEKGMVGFLHINKTYYALERATASPKTKGQMQLLVVQLYQRFNDGHWFPIQLNTDMKLNQLKIGAHQMVVEARTYIKDVRINPPLKRNEFGALEVEVNDDAVKNAEIILPQYRQNELDKKDSVTYTTIDSLSEKLKLQKRMEFIEALLDGKIRVSILDFPIDKVINFNNYEGFRLGLGIETNQRMLKWMRLGGYFAYGFTDNAFKYGGFLEFLPYRKKDIRIRFDYKRDVFSSGLTDFPLAGPIQLTGVTNQIVLNVFDSIQLFEGSFSIKPFANWQIRFAMNHQTMDPTRAYRFLPDTLHNQQYNFTEIEFTTRWGIKEKYILVGSRQIAKPTKFPVLHFHITQSLPGLGGEFSYTKLMARATQTFNVRKLGKSNFIIEGGYILGDAPYGKLFANRGTFANFSIVSRTGFETMRSNEFLMDSYVSLYFNHNFGTLFRVKKFIRPELSIVHNIGFGWLREPDRHVGIPFKTMKHGLFEGGIVLDNILVLGGSGFGVGVFYRYGSTASGDPLQNIFVKMSLAVAL